MESEEEARAAAAAAKARVSASEAGRHRAEMALAVVVEQAKQAQRAADEQARRGDQRELVQAARLREAVHDAAAWRATSEGLDEEARLARWHALRAEAGGWLGREGQQWQVAAREQSEEMASKADRELHVMRMHAGRSPTRRMPRRDTWLGD